MKKNSGIALSAHPQFTAEFNGWRLSSPPPLTRLTADETGLDVLLRPRAVVRILLPASATAEDGQFRWHKDWRQITHAVSSWGAVQLHTDEPRGTAISFGSRKKTRILVELLEQHGIPTEKVRTIVGHLL